MAIKPAAVTKSRTNGGSSTSSVKMRKNPVNIDRSVRDFFKRTNLDLAFIGLFFAVYSYHVQANEEVVAAAADIAIDAQHGGVVKQALDQEVSSMMEHGITNGTAAHAMVEELAEHEDAHGAIHAVLFPWFAQIIGIFVYYFLSRFAHALPYTAVMFVMGFSVGYSMNIKGINILDESMLTWMSIPGQLLLMVFLPGLLYIDAYHIDVHLFIKSFMQLLILAFPMVLAGTALTACVAYYIFPYSWSFDLCMTFGSILCATDPVAVAVLLNELGAPPRLKMHVSGEALLNDGSAYVFYTIFKMRYFFLFGVSGVGEAVNWGEGFKLFFQLALGGMCIGLAFGAGAVILLFTLNRRLSGEDSIAQVVVTITAAYLAYFSADIHEMSGIIAVLFLGVTVKALGVTMVNDPHLMMHFWEVIEWLLNTLLFTLAGGLWGFNMRDNFMTEHAEKALLSYNDWGYLILLFVLLTAIRFVLMFAFYPIFSRIGIGSSWQEVLFMCWSGLRGAVGIALALSLQSDVWRVTMDEPDQEKQANREEAEKVFGFVGGIALLTLIINAPTSGPLLKKLGLVTPTETRLQMVDNFKKHMTHFCLTEYVAMLAEARFKDLDYMVVKEHVPFLRDITYEQVQAALKEQEETNPCLKNLIPYFEEKRNEKGAPLRELGRLMSNAEDEDEATEEIELNDGVEDEGPGRQERRMTLLKNRRLSIAKIKCEQVVAAVVERAIHNRSVVVQAPVDVEHAGELRNVFVEALRSSYASLIEMGELESRSFIAYSLTRSLDYVGDAVSRGSALNDWEALQVASNSFLKYSETALHGFFSIKHQIKNRTLFRLDRGYFIVHMRTCEALAFIKGHEMAREALKKYCRDAAADDFSAAELQVLEECNAQIKLAQAALDEIDPMEVQQIKSHYACQILLNKSAHFLQTLTAQGLMTPGEASNVLEEIESCIQGVVECQKDVHDGQYSTSKKSSIMQRFRGMSFFGSTKAKEVDVALSEDPSTHI